MPTGRQQKLKKARRSQQDSSEDSMSTEEDDVLLEEEEDDEEEDSSSYSGGGTSRRSKRGTKGRYKPRGMPTGINNQRTKRAANRAAAHRCRDRKRAALESCERELVQCLREHAQLQHEATAMEQQLLQEVASLHALKTFMLSHSEHLGKRLPPEAAVQLQHLLHGMPGVSGYPVSAPSAKPAAASIKPHSSSGSGSQQQGGLVPGTAINASSMQPDASPTAAAAQKDVRACNVHTRTQPEPSTTAAVQPGSTAVASVSPNSGSQQGPLGAHGHASRPFLANVLNKDTAATSGSQQQLVPQHHLAIGISRVPAVAAPRPQPMFTPFAAYPQAPEEGADVEVVTVTPSSNLKMLADRAMLVATSSMG